MEQANAENHGIGIRIKAFVDKMVDMLAKIGTYAAPTVEDEAAMSFCLTLDRLDW